MLSVSGIHISHCANVCSYLEFDIASIKVVKMQQYVIRNRLFPLFSHWSSLFAHQITE